MDLLGVYARCAVIRGRAVCVGSVASEPVAYSLVFLVAEGALVVDVAELLELVRLLGGVTWEEVFLRQPVGRSGSAPSWRSRARIRWMPKPHVGKEKAPARSVADAVANDEPLLFEVDLLYLFDRDQHEVVPTRAHLEQVGPVNARDEATSFHATHLARGRLDLETLAARERVPALERRRGAESSEGGVGVLGSSCGASQRPGGLLVAEVVRERSLPSNPAILATCS
jgi:hypothetical protein